LCRARENAKSWHSVSVHPFNEACAPRRLAGGRQEGRRESEVETVINGQTRDETRSKILMRMPRMDRTRAFSTASSLIPTPKKCIKRRKETHTGRKKNGGREKEIKRGEERGPPAVESVENAAAPRFSHIHNTQEQSDSLLPRNKRNEQM